MAWKKRTFRDWILLAVAVLTLMSMLGIGVKFMTPGTKAMAKLEEKHDEDIEEINDRIDRQQELVLTPIYGLYEEQKKMREAMEANE